MKPLRAIVVDDERLARRGLALRLADLPQVELIAECANGREALEVIATESPDLVFLDIQMPGLDGFGLVCELQADAMPLIIFVTAYDQYAIDAFRIHAVDYVLKPIDDERLQEAVERATQRHALESLGSKANMMALVSGRNGADNATQLMPDDAATARPIERLTIKDGNEFQFIRLADIQWIDAAGDYMCVHAGGKTHIMRSTMKRLEDSLDPRTFIRVHRSSIVNTNYIASASAQLNGEYLLTLEGGTRLKVSRGYRDRIRALLAD